jgi:Protein of unknown function (DUF4232)
MRSQNPDQMKRCLMLGVLCALGAAACGSSSSTTTVTTTTTATTTRTVTATAPPASTGTTPSAASTATTSAGNAGCRAGDLAISYLGQQGATGHGELGFSLRNVSDAGCSVFGYPGVLFLDRAGRALPTRSSRTTRDFFGTTTVRKLVLHPGDSVSFRVGVTHVAASANRCTTAYQLQVIAPNDTATMRTTITHGAYECVIATVSPVQPGRSAYP